MTDPHHERAPREGRASPADDDVDVTALSTRRSHDPSPPSPSPPGPRRSSPPHSPAEPDDATVVASGAGRRPVAARTPLPGPVRGRAVPAEADPGASVDATLIARGRSRARTAGDDDVLDTADATSIAARRETLGTAEDAAVRPADPAPDGSHGMRPRGHGAGGAGVTVAAPTDGPRTAYVPDTARLATRHAPRRADPVVIPRVHVEAPAAAAGGPLPAEHARAARARRAHRRRLLMLCVVVAAGALVAAVVALVLLLI